jgi:hypothetical protein
MKTTTAHGLWSHVRARREQRESRAELRRGAVYVIAAVIVYYGMTRTSGEWRGLYELMGRFALGAVLYAVIVVGIRRARPQWWDGQGR